jgi:hypothetical protein
MIKWIGLPLRFVIATGLFFMVLVAVMIMPKEVDFGKEISSLTSFVLGD